jgi:phospho-N-acetylmuramoyl-pentapeptide-transferase
MSSISESLLAALASFLIVVLLGPVVIPLLRRLRMGQTVRDDGPRTHLKKAGTPTMGGLMIITGFVVASLAFSRGLFSPSPPGRQAAIAIATAIIVAVVHGFLGFVDDFLKVARKRPLGLRARYKLLAQVLVAVFLSYVATRVLDLGTTVTLPFWGIAADLGAAYHVLVVIIIIGTSNAMNLTDGLDGLAAGASVASFAAFALVSLATSSPTLAVFSAAVAGACLGFLVHNHHPARVWMGDTGSLALGAALASVAVLTKTELLLPIIGGLYVVEALSDVIQVVSFKLTGRRVFKMAPIHHHFELLGMRETDIVFRFWLVSCAFGVLGLYGLKGLGR